VAELGPVSSSVSGQAQCHKKRIGRRATTTVCETAAPFGWSGNRKGRVRVGAGSTPVDMLGYLLADVNVGRADRRDVSSLAAPICQTVVLHDLHVLCVQLAMVDQAPGSCESFRGLAVLCIGSAKCDKALRKSIDLGQSWIAPPRGFLGWVPPGPLCFWSVPTCLALSQCVDVARNKSEKGKGCGYDQRGSNIVHGWHGTTRDDLWLAGCGALRDRTSSGLITYRTGGYIAAAKIYLVVRC
jgi:hypothetical protein